MISSLPPDDPRSSTPDAELSAALQALLSHLETGTITAPALPPKLVPPGYSSESLYLKLRSKNSVAWNLFAAILFQLVQEGSIDIRIVTSLTEYAASKDEE